VLRFNREARALLEEGTAAPTLGEVLERGRYSREFRDYYILPMGGAIWSTRAEEMADFPAPFFLRFLANHGLLSIKDHLQWRTVRGGSRSYVEALTEPFHGKIRTSSPVEKVIRGDKAIDVRLRDGETCAFDQVVLAVDSGRALDLLASPTSDERGVLGAFRSTENEAVLHHWPGFLPRNRRARASWNYIVPEEPGRRITVTYDMSRLQGLDSPMPICVTLNPPAPIPREHVLHETAFRHPFFTVESVQAQESHGRISGVDRIHYCGAWWRNGFHEDGVWSGQRVARRILGGARSQKAAGLPGGM
jgi:predicted NAD/FAD-binding protein